MVLNGADLTDEEIAKIKQKAQITEVKSNFGFIQGHRGLRLGALHILMGTAGSGKSTVTRAVISDMVKVNQESVYIWLSEESTTDFMIGLADNKVSKGDRSKLLIESELDSESSVDEILERVKFTGANVLVFDNITTSRFYMDKAPDAQAEFVTKLKKFASENEVAIFLIAHTGKKISDNHGQLITENDIRGASSIVNLANFFYILQRFEIGNRYFQTIRVQKHRGQQMRDRMFELVYSMEEHTYTEDKKIDFEEFKEAFNQRNKL